MEVAAHDSIQDAWLDAYEIGKHVLHRWFGEALLEKVERAAACHDTAAGKMDTAAGKMDGAARQWRDQLEAKHLTPEQQQYAGRVYPKKDNRHMTAPPWPAPDRVGEETTEALASIVREEPPTSPKAWGAVRVLGVAAVIEAVHWAREAVE